MAQRDDLQDPWDQPYNGGAPADNTGPGSAVYDRVAQLYQLALGRAGSDAEIHQWADGKSVNDLGTIQQQIYATPDAQAYGSRNANPVAPKDPLVDPGITQPPAPGPAPAPAQAPGPAPSPQTQAAPVSIPSSTAPAPLQAPPAFTYDPYTATSTDDVLNDPDFQLTRDQGIQSIAHKNAALGTLNTGGTIGDFVGFASNLAHAKYGDIDARRFGQYQANRANAFDTYKTNYGIGKDVYDTNYKDQYADPFANNMASAGLAQNNSQFNASLGQNNNQFNTTLDFNKWLQNYKMSVTDPFDQKYKTLSLL